MQIKIKKTHPNATIPTQATEFAGGWDVTCVSITQVSKDLVICNLGFQLEPPIGAKVTLVPRSSFTNYKWILQNSPGLGDCDYRGDYQYRFRAIPTGVQQSSTIDSSNQIIPTWELTYSEFPYKVGDRIGQIYIEQVIPIEWIESEELNDTIRGDGGYGSTN